MSFLFLTKDDIRIIIIYNSKFIYSLWWRCVWLGNKMYSSKSITLVFLSCNLSWFLELYCCLFFVNLLIWCSGDWMFWNYYCLWYWYDRVCISFLSTLYLFLSFCYTDFALGVIYFWCFLSLLVFLSLIFLREFLVLILHVFCRWNKYFWSLDLYFCVLLWIGYFDFYCFLAC